MDIKRGESALQQLEKGSVSLNELLQDMKTVAQKVATLNDIQKELVESVIRLKGTIRHFDDRLLEALSPILQELSLRLKDTSDNLAVLKFELSTQLTSIGNRLDGMERQQLRTHSWQKWTLILLGVTCDGSLGSLYFIARPFIS
jgi:hypothetical protein